MGNKNRFSFSNIHFTMFLLKKFYFSLGLLLASVLLAAQNTGVGINKTNDNPDPSAMLDVQSNDQGVLFPRMTGAMRQMINSPAAGLLVYDTDTKSFWYYTGLAWTNLSSVVTDNNTLVGDGTVANPLSLASNGASNNDVLSWNGTNWAPSASPWLTNGNNIVYTPNRKVGIGLNVPGGLLHVKGDILAEEDNSGDEGGLRMLDSTGIERIHLNHQYFPSETRFRIEVLTPDPMGVARIQFFRNTDAATKRVEFFRGNTATFGTERSAVIGIGGEDSFFQFSGGNMGIGTDTPDPNAILDVTSDSKGVLFPRMSTTERIALGNANPQNGLLVFDSNTNTYWYWVNSGWVELYASGLSVRDIAIFEERQAQGTCLSYGNNAANTVITRRLNTEHESSPSGSVTLLNPNTSNATLQFQPGKYLISASATIIQGGAHKLLLIDEVNQSQIVLTGTSELSDAPSQTASTILGIVTVGPAGQTMKLVNVYNSAAGSCIFGTSAGVSGADEVFARIMIEKL